MLTTSCRFCAIAAVLSANMSSCTVREAHKNDGPPNDVPSFQDVGSAGESDAGVSDAGLGLDSSIECPAVTTDRKSPISFVFRNRTTRSVFIATVDSVGKVMLVVNTDYYHPRGWCSCHDVAKLIPEGGCQVFCDQDDLIENSPVEIAPGTTHVSGGEGEHFFLCKYSCFDRFKDASLDLSCYDGVPIASGDYLVALCVGREPVAPSFSEFRITTATSADFCPEGFKKVVKPFYLGIDDEQVTIDIEEKDL